MKLGAAIAGVIGVTAVAGTLVFNTDAAEKVKANIEELKAKIVAYADNDKALVAKYNDLKEDAEKKIADLETKKSKLETEKSELNAEKIKLENQVTADASKIAELNTQIEGLNTQIEGLNTQITQLENQATENATEIKRLQDELTKANNEIENLETLSNEAVKEANGYEPTNPDTLPQLPLAEVSGYFKPEASCFYYSKRKYKYKL